MNLLVSCLHNVLLLLRYLLIVIKTVTDSVTSLDTLLLAKLGVWWAYRRTPYLSGGSSTAVGRHKMEDIRGG